MDEQKPREGRTCPLCGTAHPRGTVWCECGGCVDPEKLTRASGMISGWKAPVIGAVVGAGLVLRSASSGPSFSWVALLAGAGLGFLAGCILWYRDWREEH
ncbi:MAG: hypothetical protein ACYS9X_10950 [Planctomycetota bacterium]|jgi:hypothetical protein